MLDQPHGRLTERDARPIVAMLVDAVAHCHHAGVAHLDVTPRNAMYDHRTRQLRLIDYGASAFVGAGASALRRAACEPEHEIQAAMRGLVRERGGAPNYRAPERHAADDEDDDEGSLFDGFAADSYAVGCSLFFVLTGRDAFDWETWKHADDPALIVDREDLFDDIAQGKIPFERCLATAPPVRHARTRSNASNACAARLHRTSTDAHTHHLLRAWHRLVSRAMYAGCSASCSPTFRTNGRICNRRGATRGLRVAPMRESPTTCRPPLSTQRHLR